MLIYAMVVYFIRWRALILTRSQAKPSQAPYHIELHVYSVEYVLHISSVHLCLDTLWKWWWEKRTEIGFGDCKNTIAKNKCVAYTSCVRVEIGG